MLRVSTSGAAQPRWRDDGKELFYVSVDNNLMVVPLKENDEIEPGQPSALFKFVSIADTFAYST